MRSTSGSSLPASGTDAGRLCVVHRRDYALVSCFIINALSVSVAFGLVIIVVGKKVLFGHVLILSFARARACVCMCV